MFVSGCTQEGIARQARRWSKNRRSQELTCTIGGGTEHAALPRRDERRTGKSFALFATGFDSRKRRGIHRPQGKNVDCFEQSTECFAAPQAQAMPDQKQVWILAAITYRRARAAALGHDLAIRAAASSAKLIFPQMPDATACVIVMQAINRTRADLESRQISHEANGERLTARNQGSSECMGSGVQASRR